MNSFSHMFASVYAGASPIMGKFSTLCMIHGQQMPCGREALAFWGIFWLAPIAFVLTFLLSLLTVAGMWKIFEKAGKPGWTAIVPVYNLVIMLEITKRPVWWILLFFIPFANIVVGFILMYALARSFGKGIGYTIGLIFLPWVFYPMLGFGAASYVK